MEGSSKDLAIAIEKLANVHNTQLAAIAKAVEGLALQLKYLGNGDTVTTMGAIEYLGSAVEKAGEAISQSIAARE